MESVKNIVYKFNKPFKIVVDLYSEDFKELQNQEKEWLENLENKNNLLKNETDKKLIDLIIRNLKDGSYQFTDIDTKALSIFTAKINSIVRITNRINNFKEGTLLEDGEILELYELFNAIKLADRFTDLNIHLNSNLKSFLPHLYSVIKHCQNPIEYPIYYKYWKNISKEVFNIQDDYDSFCAFYRTLPVSNRHLNFGCYLGTIGIQIAKEVNKEGIISSVNDKEYKYLKRDVINLDKYLDYIVLEGVKKEVEQKIKKYWICAPGENASYWEEFYEKGIMGLGWDALGDLNKYVSREEIVAELQKIENITTSKKNDATANFEFKNGITIGDVIIVKKGITELLGYGVVTSDYFYDEIREYYQKLRKVEWKKKGSWKTDFNLPLKTLTDVTKYSSEHPDFEFYYELLLSIMENGEEKVKRKNPINIPQNLILYGPPGTGKTYNSINIALEICGIPIPEQRKEAVQKFKELMDEEQIVFTTFHQSMDYEDFVEGIKPILVENGEISKTKEMIYDVEQGIFKRICDSANEKEIVQKDSLLKLSNRNRTYKVSLKSDNQSYNVKRECFENNEIRIGWDDTGNLDDIFLDGQNNEYFEKLGRNDKNSIQYFYELKAGDVVLVFHDLKTIDGIGIVEDESYFFNSEYSEFRHVRKVKWISKNLPIRIFELNKETNLTLPTVYRLNRISMDDITKLIQEQGINSEIRIEKNEKNYVLIIDEINRGNISKIFGELITLIEPDKRQGEENELEVTLPYSKSKFSVPPNLFIIGTMNTADRSIALIDTALRRRFDFKEMMPDSSLLSDNIEGINLQLLLDKINERIEFLLDRDHTIGHSYLIKAKSKNDVCAIFKNKVIPLLQEYFYNDWEKIQLVLGDNKSWGKSQDEKLVQLKKYYSVEEEKKLFGYDVEEYEDEKIYEINPALKDNRFNEISTETFLHIYQKPEKIVQP